MHNCWIEGQTNTLADAESVIFHQADDNTLGEVLYDPVGCGNLAVNNNELEAITFYPNPASNQFLVENIQQLESLKIFDGATLKSKNCLFGISYKK